METRGAGRYGDPCCGFDWSLTLGSRPPTGEREARSCATSRPLPTRAATSNCTNWRTGGYVLAAMRARAPWARRTLLDLGCGSGYWLGGYADEAAEVIGVEPDPRLLSLAADRDPRIRVRHGSAEHLPLPDQSVDVVHARFAYFFPPGCDRGLAEVMRVLRPGGTLVAIGNDLGAGDFAGLLRAAEGALEPAGGPAADAWWAARGADRTTVRSSWLRMEFPLKIANRWLAAHPAALGLSYSYSLHAIDKPDGLLRAW